MLSYRKERNKQTNKEEEEKLSYVWSKTLNNILVQCARVVEKCSCIIIIIIKCGEIYVERGDESF